MPNRCAPEPLGTFGAPSPPGRPAGSPLEVPEPLSHEALPSEPLPSEPRTPRVARSWARSRPRGRQEVDSQPPERIAPRPEDVRVAGSSVTRSAGISERNLLGGL